MNLHRFIFSRNIHKAFPYVQTSNDACRCCPIVLMLWNDSIFHSQIRRTHSATTISAMPKIHTNIADAFTVRAKEVNRFRRRKVEPKRAPQSARFGAPQTDTIHSWRKYATTSLVSYQIFTWHLFISMLLVFGGVLRRNDYLGIRKLSIENDAGDEETTDFPTRTIPATQKWYGTDSMWQYREH